MNRREFLAAVSSAVPGLALATGSGVIMTPAEPKTLTLDDPETAPQRLLWVRDGRDVIVISPLSDTATELIFYECAVPFDWSTSKFSGRAIHDLKLITFG